ncbi:MAG: hypothetical protein MUE96_11455 [Bacteroidia bacterium]|jgi:hypothetical protein|nr:hypothetical protein [Bacteroidia bacterium]
MKLIATLLALSLSTICLAQQDTTKKAVRVLIVPYQPMMHFSDADEDMAKFSKREVPQVRNQLRTNLEANVYHQLLGSFDAISLMRSNTLNGEADLNRIYAATRYQVYSKKAQDEYLTNKGNSLSVSFKNLTEKWKRNSKNQTFWTSDSAVMLGAIGDKELFPYLHKKYQEDYILFITQFEVNTSNKNTIEWLKQEYKRTYTIHYNLFDHSGMLIRAETLSIEAGGENKLEDINSKYLILLAQKLKEIVSLANQ